MWVLSGRKAGSGHRVLDAGIEDRAYELFLRPRSRYFLLRPESVRQVMRGSSARQGLAQAPPALFSSELRRRSHGTWQRYERAETPRRSTIRSWI